MNQQAQFYSLDAERSVIGSILLEPDVLDSVSEIVLEGDFFRPEHCIIFSSIVALAEAGEPIDIVTVGEWVGKNNQLNEIGGLSYLIDIATNTPSSSNAASYAAIVKEHSTRRKIYDTTGHIAHRVKERDGMTSGEMIEEAERLFSSLDDGATKEGEFESVGAILGGVIDDIDERFHSDETISGLKTGLEDLDEMTSGLQDTDMIIIAGRPASGKSTISINIAEHAAINEGKVVPVFSLEMPKKQLVKRMISSIGRIEQDKLKTGKLEQHDFDKMMGAAKKLKDSKILIDDTAGIGPSYVRKKLKKLEREYGRIDLVVIDYLQLMKIDGYTEGRVNEVSEISRSLKAIAKEFNCPLIALSQLNRGLEQRPSKRPVNSDLRESGSIEQDADIIIHIYRDEVYHEDSPHKGVAEIIIGKQRNGPIGTCRAAFLGQFARFENLAKGYGDF